MADNLPDPAARIEELNGRLTDLTAEELTELRGLVAAQLDAAEADELTAEAVEHITALSEIAVAVGEESTRRETEAAELQSRRNEALGRARGAITSPEPEQPETDQAPEAAPEPEQQPEPVAASAQRPARRPLTAFRQPAVNPVAERPAERQEAGRIRASLVAGGRDMSDDSEDEQLRVLSERFDTGFRAMQRGGPDGDRFLVASNRWTPPHTVVRGEDHTATRARMDAAVREQLTAGGGICKPVTVDYNIPTWVNKEQPVRDALPSIGAPRGGLQYAQPVPYDATVYGPGVSIWTAANDANPGGSNTGPGGTGTGPTTKPCIEIDCSAFTETDIEAITQCLTVGNMRARFSPENVQMAMDYLDQAFSSKAEAERLRQMRVFAKHVTFGAAAFGASRDVLTGVDKINAYFRSVYRLSETVRLRVVWQSWVRELFRIDLAKAAFPFEGDLPQTSLGITNAQIDSWLDARNITAVWALDDDIGDQTFAKATAGTQASPSTFPVFPLWASGTTGHVTIRALFYPEGTYQRLDGGQLDLGVVRDSTLNAQNKYQMFGEVFEAVAPRGFEALDVRFDVIPSGASAGTITPA